MTPNVVSSYHLFSGILSLKIRPLPNAGPASVIPVTIELTRPDGLPLSVKLNLHIVPEKEPGPGGRPHNGPTPKGKELGAPRLWLVYREQRDGFKTWAEMEPQPWNENSTSEVKGDALDVYVNMDARILNSFLRRHRHLPGGFQDRLREAWKLGIYFCSLSLHRDLAKYEEEAVFADAIDAVAKVLLEAFYAEALVGDGLTEP